MDVAPDQQPPRSAEGGTGLPPVSIIIPAFNEEAGLPAVLEALTATADLADAEILVVDDGSSDGTAAVAGGRPRVRLVRHRVNRGYGAALASGIRASTGRLVVWFDADGQHRVEDLLRLVRRMREEDLDYCIGVRGPGGDQRLRRRFGKKVLRLIIRLASGRPIQDFNCGLRGFKREVMLRYLHLLPKGFGASTLTTMLMVERRYCGEEIDVEVAPRVGKSSLKELRDGLRTLMIILGVLLMFKPMRFFGTIGALLVGAGAVYGLVTAVQRGHGFPVLAALAVMLGVQSLFFGLLCDQIGSLRVQSLERD